MSTHLESAKKRIARVRDELLGRQPKTQPKRFTVPVGVGDHVSQRDIKDSLMWALYREVYERGTSWEDLAPRASVMLGFPVTPTALRLRVTRWAQRDGKPVRSQGRPRVD